MVASQSTNSLIAETAHWTAAARSQEDLRPDALFHDPWAAALAGKSGAAWLERLSGNAFGTIPMIIRTRYFDDFLKEKVWKLEVSQVVVLAAGLDTRAYRQEWPAKTRFFELDKPEVLAYKQEILDAAGIQPSCTRISIPGDLASNWPDALISQGFDSNLPAIWLMEGILFYLPNELTVHLLEEVSRLSAAGSWLGMDIINHITLNSPLTRTWVEMQAQQGAPWIGWMDDPRGLLGEIGWQAAISQPGAPDASYGRWPLPVIPLEAPNLPHSWYVTAVKR